MSLTHLRPLLAASVVLFGLGTASAVADPISKDACVDAHSRGQDARETGKLSLARKLFLTCAQSACPALVQSDCAKFANDLDQQQPTVTFAARDSAGNDLPDTAVYVDDLLVVTRLDDGRPHDADPGRHTVKFQNGGRDQVLTIVLNTGEKGRAIVAKFPASAQEPVPAGRPAASVAPPAAAPAPTAVVPPPAPAAPAVKHPFGAKLAMIAGGVAIVGGGVLAVVGAGRVPSDCSTSTNTCVVPPGDPALSKASSAVKLEDLGIGLGAVGAAAVIGGAIWYVTGKHEHAEQPGLAAVPWLAPGGGGLALSGRL